MFRVLFCDYHWILHSHHNSVLTTIDQMANGAFMVKEFPLGDGLETSVPHVLACSHAIFNSHPS